MDIGDFLSSINKFDLLVMLFAFGMFVLGYVQGTIRRVLGLASMLFSFLFAANLRDSVGSYLAANWNQFPDEYAVMLGFGIIFVAATIAFTLVIQGFYHKQSLFKRATVADEIIGGLLGVVQALFLVGCVIVILDSFFRLPAIPQTRRRAPVPPQLLGRAGHVDDGRAVPVATDPGLHPGLRPADPGRTSRRCTSRRPDLAVGRDTVRSSRPAAGQAPAP